MPVTNYYTVEGEILGEKTTGGSRVDYLTDALGSVTATVDQNAQVVNTYRYKPSGSQLAKTGGGSDPKFQWVGSAGYRQTGRTYSDVYVRARHYDTSTGRWTTEDSLEISVANRFLYADASPVFLIDFTGNQPKKGKQRLQKRPPIPSVQQKIKQLCPGIVQRYSICPKRLPQDTLGSLPISWSIVTQDVLCALIYCLAEAESTFNPRFEGKCWKDESHKLPCYGLFNLGELEGGRCGHANASDKDIGWQMDCVMQNMINQCEVRKSRTLIPSMLGAFEYFSGMINVGKEACNANNKITKCMSAQGLPNWWNYLRSVSCDRCQPCLVVEGKQIDPVDPKDDELPSPPYQTKHPCDYPAKKKRLRK